MAAGSSNGSGGAGFWDNRSYDSWTQGNGIASPCTAGAIIFGGGCDWKAFAAPVGGEPYQQLSNPLQADPGSMQYLARTDGSIPDNFYFTGPWALDFSVLFQLSAWDDTVEFGWYEAGNPNNRTSLLPKTGRPPGPTVPTMAASVRTARYQPTSQVISACTTGTRGTAIPRPRKSCSSPSPSSIASVATSAISATRHLVRTAQRSATGTR